MSTFVGASGVAPWSRQDDGRQLVETPVGTVSYRRTGAGAAVVLVHGGLSDGRSWMPQLDGLADLYDVIAWDAPGCGSSVDPATDLTLADYADVLAVLIRDLVVGPVHLVGHSFGAGVALCLHDRHRDLVRSLVLSGAYAGWRGSLPPAEVAARLTSALEDLVQPPTVWVDRYLAGFFGRSVSPEITEAVRSMMLDVRPAGALPMVRAIGEADLRPVLPTITVPTLLVYGAEDVRAPREVSTALHRAIAGSTLRLVSDAGHDVNLEAPEEYNNLVRTFLRESSGSG
jgi:pimeloyl-ACP methyl ester carboxylesterase